MADNLGEVAFPTSATTANTAKQPKKGKTDVSRQSSKRESDNKRNKKQAMWRMGMVKQKQREEGVAELLP